MSTPISETTISAARLPMPGSSVAGRSPQQKGPSTGRPPCRAGLHRRQLVDVVEVNAGQECVVFVEAPDEGEAQLADLRPHAVRARSASLSESLSPAMRASIIALPDTPVISVTSEVSFTLRPPGALQPLHLPDALTGRSCPVSR